MGDDHTDDRPSGRTETDWERRRRLARVFGDVEPGTTSDERDPEPSGQQESASERWLKAQVPPHHG